MIGFMFEGIENIIRKGESADSFLSHSILKNSCRVAKRQDPLMKVKQQDKQPVHLLGCTNCINP